MVKAIFWGTRGSVPAPLTAAAVEAKIKNCLKRSLEIGLKDAADIDRFLAEDCAYEDRMTFGGNTSCVEVEHGSDRIIFDLGSGARELAGKLLAGGNPSELSLDILMSHVHWDHIQGFPFFAPAYIPGVKLRIWAVMR